jgi:hypothetical protein
MPRTIQWKTPLEIQEYLWLDNALVRPEDLATAEIIDWRQPAFQSTPAMDLMFSPENLLYYLRRP